MNHSVTMEELLYTTDIIPSVHETGIHVGSIDVMEPNYDSTFQTEFE